MSTAEKAPGFTYLFMGTLLSPARTFKQLALLPPEVSTAQIPLAFAVVVLVFAVDGFRLFSTRQPESAFTNILFNVMLGLALWALTFAVVAACALCFGVPGSRARASLVTLAWSMLPLLFLTPLTAAKSALGIIYPLSLSIPLVWIFFLQLVAINQSYQMKPWQSLLLVLMVPWLLGGLQLAQFAQSIMVILPGMFS